MRRLTLLPLFVLSFALIAACPPATTGGDDDDEATETPSPTPTPAWMPDAGHWTWAPPAFVQDDCNAEAQGDQISLTGFTLVHTGNGLFDIDPDEKDRNSLHCTLVDQAYTCEDDTIVTDLSTFDPPIEMAVITSVQASSGSFVDGTSMSGTATFNVSCVGDNCWVAALGAGNITFPCITTINISSALD